MRAVGQHHAEPFGVQQLRRVGGHRPAGQDVQVRNVRPLDRLFQRGLADDHRRDPGLVRHAERPVKPRPPHVGVDDQDAPPGLRHGDAEVDRGGGLPLLRAGAGDDHRLQRSVRRHEEDVRSDRPAALRRHRLRIEEHAQVALAQVVARLDRLAAGRRTDDRHQPQHRRPQELLDVLLGLERVVERLDRERQTDTGPEPHHQPEQQILNRLRPHGNARDDRPLQHADVVGLHRAGDVDLLLPAGDDPVHLLFLLRGALEGLVLDLDLRELDGLLLLLLHQRL